jgi:signal transduction histidine kinase
MKLNLRTKLALAVAALVLAVVGLVSVVFLGTLTRRVIHQSRDRAAFVAQEVFLEAQQALLTAAEQGARPVSGKAEDLNLFVQQTLEANQGWNAAVKGALGYSPSIYEITVNNADGITLVSSDAHRSGRYMAKRPDMDSLVHADFATQIEVLYGPPTVYEFKLPFNLGDQPFGDVRVAVSTALLRNQISPGLKDAGWFALGAVLLSTLAAAALSGAILAPIQTISAQLDRISAGESDIGPVERADEFGQVSTKISKIGRELRDVREVFSTLRHNLDQIMSQLDDGLLLVNATGRIVLASPSASQFLGMRTDELIGRMVSEVFPPEHPLRQILNERGDIATETEVSEALLAGPTGPLRTVIRMQPVSEGGVRTGSLVTLTNLESRERIGSELQVSEHLASIGRVTAGVAHEVKNPLNSMRVWLEVLKSNLPVEGESQQATKMLDSEIERLDHVVKTFLDFTRPVALQVEDVDLTALVSDVIRAARLEIGRLGTEAVVKLPASGPLVRADGQLVRQAILNLVLNACQAMPSGGTLTVEVLREEDSAKIVVSDTGVGIAPQHRKRIFQLYFTTRPGGNGVGLANTLHFVQLQGGSIDFESEPGQGTRFTIRLPIARAVERRKHPAPTIMAARTISTPRT